MSENGEIYTAGNKFYTAAGTDGMDKFHLWARGVSSEHMENMEMFLRPFWSYLLPKTFSSLSEKM